MGGWAPRTSPPASAAQYNPKADFSKRKSHKTGEFRRGAQIEHQADTFIVASELVASAVKTTIRVQWTYSGYSKLAEAIGFSNEIGAAGP